MLATLHAENTPSFSSFFARGNALTWAFFWLARCCWLSPGLAGSLFPDPELVAVVLDPADPVDWVWRSRGCKACAAGSDISTLLDSSSSSGLAHTLPSGAVGKHKTQEDSSSVYKLNCLHRFIY